MVLGFGLLAAVGLVFARLMPALLLDLAHCPLRDFTGIPCPACGGTLAATSLVQGRWLKAFLANPLVTSLIVAGAAAWLGALVMTAVPRWRRAITLSRDGTRAARGLAALAVLGTWAWLLFRYL